jgi:hypothetical protein
MTIREKPDTPVFQEYLKQLKQKLYSDARRIWPYFLFHFTDVNNIVSILKSGQLLSRYQLASNGVKHIDIASPDVIGITENQWKDYVRFYFRPRTPTLYHNEGFRCLNRRQLGGAHCPIPIYLLFDLEAIVCRLDSQFSYGSLARSNSRVFSKASDFKGIPFDLVYHDSGFSLEQKDKIIYHRQAEVIVPQSINLDNLTFIWCRSAAERETLRHLMGDELWQKWGKVVRHSAENNFFYRQWIYVNQVNLSDSTISIYFNQCQQSRDLGPFAASLVIDEVATGTKYLWSDKKYIFGKDPLTIDLSNLSSPQNYKVQLYLDQNLAYANTYIKQDDDDIPF